MFNPYEVEKVLENQKADLDCVSRQGWKWASRKGKRLKLSIRQLFALESNSRIACRECLDC